MNSDFLAIFAPLGRVLLVALFLLSGWGKIENPSAAIAYIASTGTSQPQIAYALSVAIEIGGSILLLLGYQTRLVAAAFVVFCVATALMAHNNVADQNQLIHFMKNISIAGGFLQLVAFGAGAFSLDARLSQGRKNALHSAGA